MFTLTLAVQMRSRRAAVTVRSHLLPCRQDWGLALSDHGCMSRHEAEQLPASADRGGIPFRVRRGLGRGPVTVPGAGPVAANHSGEGTRPCCPSPSYMSEDHVCLELERHPSNLNRLLLKESAPFGGNLAVTIKLFYFLVLQICPTFSIPDFSSCTSETKTISLEFMPDSTVSTEDAPQNDGNIIDPLNS